MKNNVVLTGFMGTGKTTVGRLLAERLGYVFVDTDDWIVARNGCSIPQIFQQDGEAVFRAYEREAAQVLAQGEAQIIATGGGMLVDETNAQTLAVSGDIFCLTAPVTEILWRVGDDEERPLLQHSNRQKRIEQLLTDRASAYAQFTQIDTVDKTPIEVAEAIVQMYQQK